MPRIFFIIFFISIPFINSSGKVGDFNKNIIENIRLTYYAAIEDEEKIEELRKIITKNFSKNTNEYPPLILAYYGGIEALEAKHAFWPFTKLSRLNNSMDIISEAIMMNPDNLEIRFIRFSILHYIPSILGYSTEREADLKIILELINENKYSGLDISIYNGIIDFMIQSERLSVEQENLLKEKMIVDNYYE